MEVSIALITAITILAGQASSRTFYASVVRKIVFCYAAETVISCSIANWAFGVAVYAVTITIAVLAGCAFTKTCTFTGYVNVEDVLT